MIRSRGTARNAGSVPAQRGRVAWGYAALSPGLVPGPVPGVGALAVVCTGLVAPAYGDPRVLAVEYRRRDFRWTCEHVGDRLAVVLRDLALSRSGVRRWC